MADQVVALPYSPQPRQELFHAANARQILYGGAAGGGKSAAIRWDAIDFCMHFPGLFAVLLRNTSVQLERNHVFALKQELPDSVARYNESKKQFEFHNGSILIMKHLEHEKDVEDIQGWELHWAGVDEAGQMSPSKLSYIIGRVRLGGYQNKLKQILIDALAAAGEDEWSPEYRRMQYMAKQLPRLVMSSNPGGISHHYLKQKFIDPAPPETVFYDETLKDPKNPKDKGWSTVFIPATMDDNIFLDAGYAAQFSELPDYQQKQLRDGDWNVVPGAFFDCFQTDKHVVKAFKIPNHWTRFRACDWGSYYPFSLGWYAVSDGTPVTDRTGQTACYPEGAIIRYREFYGAKYKQGRCTGLGIKWDGAQMAERARQMQAEGEEEQIRYSVADPSMWRADSGVSQAEKAMMATDSEGNRCGITFMPADNQREAGWQQLYSMMNTTPRRPEPLFYVFEECVEFIRTIPVLVADEKNPEDIVKTSRGSEDHTADEGRYAAMSRPSITKAPKEPEPLVKPLTFNDIMDMNERHHTRASYHRI